MFWLWTFLIYWLLLFVASYIVAEVGQNYFYDEVTPYVGLKVGGASLAMAAGLTWWDPSSIDFFVGEIWYTAMLAVAGFVVFCLALRFHAPHAAMLGPVTVVIVAFTAAMAVDSLKNAGRSGFRDRPIPPQQRTIRKQSSSSVVVPVEEPAAEPKAKAGAGPKAKAKAKAKAGADGP